MQTISNFYDWLYKVFDEGGFPCRSKIKGIRSHLLVIGCFHHLNGEEALGFINIVHIRPQVKSFFTLNCRIH